MHTQKTNYDINIYICIISNPSIAVLGFRPFLHLYCTFVILMVHHGRSSATGKHTVTKSILLASALLYNCFPRPLKPPPLCAMDLHAGWLAIDVAQSCCVCVCFFVGRSWASNVRFWFTCEGERHGCSLILTSILFFSQMTHSA